MEKNKMEWWGGEREKNDVKNGEKEKETSDKDYLIF